MLTTQEIEAIAGVKTIQIIQTKQLTETIEPGGPIQIIQGEKTIQNLVMDGRLLIIGVVASVILLVVIKEKKKVARVNTVREGEVIQMTPALQRQERRITRNFYVKCNSQFEPEDKYCLTSRTPIIEMR